MSENVISLIAGAGLEPLRRRLLPEPPKMPLVPQRGDFDLSPALPRPAGRDLAPAAVLLPIVHRNEPAILFTRRTESLARHAGQVSFPGGRLHEDDASLVATALRETAEETGIDARYVSIAGFLDAYETRTGFAILPVVGLLSPDFRLCANPGEVAAIFEVPLAFFLDPKNCERHSALRQGEMRTFYAFSYEGHCIWGATAGILIDLRRRLSP